MEEETESPQMWSYTRAYKIILEKLIANVDYRDRTRKPIEAFQRLAGLKKTSKQMWTAVGKEFRVLKSGDLLWRFLHQKIKTGRDISWAKEAQQVCPIHRTGMTTNHVWLECTVTIAIWEELKTIVKDPGDEGRGTRLISPKSMDEVIALMAFSPYKGPKDRRWKGLYQSAVWCL